MYCIRSLETYRCPAVSRTRSWYVVSGFNRTWKRDSVYLRGVVHGHGSRRRGDAAASGDAPPEQRHGGKSTSTPDHPSRDSWIGIRLERAIVAGGDLIGHVGNKHRVGPGEFALEVQRIVGLIAPPQRACRLIEPESLHDVQAVAVRQTRVGGEDAWRETDGVDDQHVVFPPPDRVTCAGRGEVRWMFANVE